MKYDWPVSAGNLNEWKNYEIKMNSAFQIDKANKA